MSPLAVLSVFMATWIGFAVLTRSSLKWSWILAGCGGFLVALIMVIIVAPSSSSNDTSSSIPSQQASQNNWQEDFNLEISKLLSANSIRNCGEYRYKPYGPGYIVQCSNDGRNWTEYLVDTIRNRVSRS